MTQTSRPSDPRRTITSLRALGALPILSILIFSYLSSDRAAAAPVASLLPETATGTPEQISADSLSSDSLAFSTILDDLVVTQQRKLVSSDGATLSYQVSDDPEAGSSNILDILRKVPGVTVDTEDNVRLNGQSNFKILVNSREDPMLSGDVKTALKALPAASIKKIEVISEPGAKYDAEGTGGILNFVTETKSSLSGFSATINTWLNNSNVGGALNARGKAGKVMLGADFQYNDSHVFPRAYQHSNQETVDLNTGAVTTANSKNLTNFRFIYPKLNMSWEPDTLNLFTLSAGWSSNPWNTRSSNLRERADADGETSWRIRREINDRNSYEGLSTQASYQHTFHRPDHTFVLSYLFEWRDQLRNQTYLTEEAFNITEPAFSSSTTRALRRTHVIQADYSNRLAPHSLIEAGLKANLEDIPSDSRQYAGSDHEEAIIVDDASVGFNQFKDIYAAYASYTGSYGRWGLKAGLRWEHTRLGLKYRVGQFDSFSSRLNDWVPNGALSYNISDAQTLRAAYQMRIWRPGVSWLNPYVDDLIPDRLQYGNPHLKSEHVHNLSLGYTNYEGRFTGGARISWSYSSNDVSDVIFMEDGVLHVTYANIGRKNRITLDGNFDWKVTDNFNWSLHASTNYCDLRTHSEMLSQRNHGWQTYMSTNLIYTLPHKMRLSGYAGWYSPWIDLQGKGSGGYYYGFGVSRSFLKNDALTINLSAGNIFPESFVNKYTQRGNGVAYRGATEYKQWYAGLGITFRFGGLKSDVRRTAAVVESDQTGEGNSKK